MNDLRSFVSDNEKWYEIENIKDRIDKKTLVEYFLKQNNKRLLTDENYNYKLNVN